MAKITVEEAIKLLTERAKMFDDEDYTEIADLIRDMDNEIKIAREMRESMRGVEIQGKVRKTVQFLEKVAEYDELLERVVNNERM